MNPKALFEAVEFLLHASKHSRGPAHQAQADAHLKTLSELKADAAREFEEVAYKVVEVAEDAGHAALNVAAGELGAVAEAK